MCKCRRCNRPLKTEPYRSLGIGRICAAKEAAEKGFSKNEGDTDTIMDYDGGDFYIERLESLTSQEDGTIIPQKHTCSGIRTNIQRTIYRHSPTGFNFGYGGSGSSDTALNLLRMVTTPEKAEKYYQIFKWDFLGKEGDKLVIPRDKVIKWLKEKESVVEIQ